MKDTEFYQQILGLSSPWRVSEVQLDMAGKRVSVKAELEPGTKWFSPDCKESAHVHKWKTRKWRHLDTCQFETIIEADVPSVRYADGSIEEVAVPWADRYQRVTRMMANAVILWLKACGNVKEVAAMMNLDWDTVDRIMKAAVARGLERRKAEPVKHLGIDEKAFRRGHHYASLLNDLDSDRLWDMVEGRTTENACELMGTLSDEQKAAVEAVAMDMWQPFENAVKEHLPKADIVFDKFHISMHLNKALDAVRKAEHKEMTAKGDDRLKGTKYQWLRNFPDLRCEPGFRELYSANLKTSRAWRLKETFEGLWNYRYKVPAILFFQEWHLKVKRSRLEPMRKVARMIEERLPGMLNYLEHRITNAGSEGMNSLLARIIAQARGLRSFATLRARALFFLGKLDLAIA
jgi:transposase